mgnify:CR=1 FL=1
MKTKLFFWTVIGTFITSQIQAQNNTQINALNSEFSANLDLRAVASLFGEAQNLKDFEIDVQVFNAEFIKENLKWDTNESFDAISFDVGENVSIRNQIDLNIELINKINGTDKLIGKKNKFNEIISDFNSLEDKKFTDEARIIKIEVFNSLIEFNKMHLKTIKSEIENNLEIHIIEDSKKIEEIKNRRSK